MPRKILLSFELETGIYEYLTALRFEEGGGGCVLKCESITVGCNIYTAPNHTFRNLGQVSSLLEEEKSASQHP